MSLICHTAIAQGILCGEPAVPGGREVHLAQGCIGLVTLCKEHSRKEYAATKKNAKAALVVKSAGFTIPADLVRARSDKDGEA